MRKIMGHVHNDIKKFFTIAIFMLCVTNTAFSQTETGDPQGNEPEGRMDLSFYASTRGEMQINVIPQWKFPFLQGDHPLTSENNLALKLDASLSPIWAGLTGDAILTVAPFLSFRLGAMTGTGWNYDLFGSIPLVGLGMNKKTSINDPHDGVIGNGFDGVVWDVHAGATLQFDLAAFFPGDWNHVVVQYYNAVQYIAYTKAQGDNFWYYLGDDGLNQNSFRYNFDLFAGYAMPVFIDLAGVQFSGTLPFYNVEAGGSVRDRGFSFTTAFLVNCKINKQFSVMTIARLTNGFIDPNTKGYEREWGFDRVQFIATWRVM
jgi:hypothetical protein